MKSVPAQRMALLINDAASHGIHIAAGEDAKLLLIAGRPLKEPIAQHGPCVMNTQEEIFQAVRDFQDGRFGRTSQLTFPAAAATEHGAATGSRCAASFMLGALCPRQPPRHATTRNPMLLADDVAVLALRAATR